MPPVTVRVYSCGTIKQHWDTGDGPRNFEPLSIEEDNIRDVAPLPIPTTTPQQREDNPIPHLATNFRSHFQICRGRGYIGYIGQPEGLHARCQNTLRVVRALNQFLINIFLITNGEYRTRCRNCGSGDRGRRHLSSLRNFAELKSFTCNAQGQRQAFSPCHDEFSDIGQTVKALVEKLKDVSFSIRSINWLQ
ncbi:hypothetical protein TNCV_2195641 [Trichonephila clavipes]|nr:hypothetical protein TNCV_2195641 [Trichonephila clavipes]